MLVVNSVTQTPYIDTAERHQRTTRHMLIHFVCHKIPVRGSQEKGTASKRTRCDTEQQDCLVETLIVSVRIICRRLPEPDVARTQRATDNRTHVVLLSLRVKLHSIYDR